MTNPPGGLQQLAEVSTTDELLDGLVDDVTTLCSEVAHLRHALASRPTIDQAQGIVMMHFGVDPDRALAILVRWSQRLDVSLRIVAGTVVTIVSGGYAATDPAIDLYPSIIARLQRAEHTSC